MDQNNIANLVSWREIVLIGFAAVLLTTAANQVEPTPPTTQPINLVPDTILSSPAVKSA